MATPQSSNYRRFTPSAQAVFNLIPTDLGRPISDLRFSIVGSDLEELVSEVIGTLNPVEREVQDQQGHWFMLRIRPYRTIDNQIMGAIVALVDIDNLKYTEQSLRQTQSHLETELEAMQQVQDLSLQLVSALDLDRILNQALGATMGLLHADGGTIQLYDPQRDLLEIIAHQGFNPAFLDDFREVRWDDSLACSHALKEGQRVIIEDVQTDPEFAHYRPIAAAGYRAVQSTPLMDSQGQVLGVLSTHFHQTHRPADRELRILDLYGRMVSAMISLALAQRDRQVLIDQARVAEAANASKDEFLAMLSHELRTPLTSIMSWAQLMERGLLDATEQHQAIVAILEGALSLTKLIEDLLDVSRIIQQRFEIVPQACDLPAVLRQAIDLLQPQMAAKGLHLAIDFQPCPVQLKLDSTRISQAFLNLLSNAIKFTPSGGTITVLLTDTLTQVQVQVRDTGEGIAADQLPYVFERFQQADSSNTRRAGGLGLGLFLVRSIVEAHGGTVVADSSGVGQGATFTITLPKVTATLPTTIAPREQFSLAPVAMTKRFTERSTDLTLAGIKILLVDDDEMTLVAISFALQQFGAIVTSVYSAREAMEQLSQELPDIIISDVGLPDINGYDLIRRIRALPPEQGGQLPAISLSGYADQQSVDLALNAGFQVHISKPMDIDELIAWVLRLIQT
ncbi:ATP-binding protein [Alkalinema pantanalense CENA528]|uniref:ATP-binding protein n=1 Tax=Alkalinema pantanalense TaxID=1620705 RepID=UPI003D6F13C8